VFSPDQENHPSKAPVNRGELIVLGYKGSLPNGHRGRRKSRFALFKRPKANGVTPSTVHIHIIHFISARTLVVEYTHDNNTGTFQIGRSTEIPGSQSNSDTQSVQSTLSRFACRMICEQNPPFTARIYAAGFDSSKNIFLGEKAAKWKTSDGQMDGLTTNGVLIMHPHSGFTEDSKPVLWREISVCGNVFSLHETRTAQQRGKTVEMETNQLPDGSLIDLCGAALLWSTAEGLSHVPTAKRLEALRQEINAARSRKNVMEKIVNVLCVGLSVPMFLCGVDVKLDFMWTPALQPMRLACVGSEKTTIPLPHGTHTFHATCPFCAHQLATEQGNIRLIFQGPLD
uniref:Pellino E3 ubiquitin protein ligase family member 2 n=1 Tax=Saimiri boliviensis boliviensis TaxID=39432 RepID=A0A2K6S1W1_SAIBB